MLKKTLIVLAVAFIGIQFFKPEKNEEGGARYAIFIKYKITQDVNAVLKSACLDCHSNLTRYPWYYNVQPLTWIMANHIDKGKKQLNFMHFSNCSIAEQYHKFEKIIDVMENKEMPLSSYTWFGCHPDAKLTDAQRKTLIDWAALQMSYLEDEFPRDSLVMRK
jgi:hypothetical protein